MKNALPRSKVFLAAILFALTILAACGGDGDSESNTPSGDIPLLIVNPYKDECVVDGQYQMCYVTSVGDTGDFSPYTGEMRNFDYEWGYGYELAGTFDGDAFLVDEILNKTAEPGKEKFPMTITGGDGHIVEISNGVFEIYGEKTFTCAPEVDCASLAQVIDQDQKFTFEFETPDNPADPYMLLSWEG